MANKRESIIAAIRRSGDTITWRGEWVSRIAAECECALSTVYRAIAYLKQIGAMDGNNVYVGRVPDVEEIQALVSADGGDDVPVLLSAERALQWCEKLHCEPDMFWYLMNGWYRTCFDWVQGGSYGLMVRNHG